MQLAGQKAANSVYTTCFLLSCTAVSLSWLPSGATVMHTLSTGAQVASTVHAASECGQFVAIKCEVNGQVVHHPQAPAQTSRHHQQFPANVQTPPTTSTTITPAKGSTLEGPVKALGCGLVAGHYFPRCFLLLTGWFMVIAGAF